MIKYGIVKTEINPYVALIIDLLTFVTMITGLFFFKGVTTLAALMVEFGCLSFIRRFILLSILISILWELYLDSYANYFAGCADKRKKKITGFADWKSKTGDFVF